MKNNSNREEMKEFLQISGFDLKNYVIKEVVDYPSGLELTDIKGRKIVIYNDYLEEKVRIIYPDIKKNDNGVYVMVRMFLVMEYNNRANELGKNIKMEMQKIGLREELEYVKYIVKSQGQIISSSDVFQVEVDAYDICEYVHNEIKKLEEM